jgi:hypothetical protein
VNGIEIGTTDDGDVVVVATTDHHLRIEADFTPDEADVLADAIHQAARAARSLR